MGIHRGSRGQALVEFALILPVLVLVIFAVVDLGRGIFTYTTLAESARQAARMAIVDQTTADVSNRAITAAPTLGLTSTNVSVCYKTAGTVETDCSSPATDDCSASLQIGCLAVVVVDASYQPITPVLSSLFQGGIALQSVSTVPIEYVCPNAEKATCP